MDELDPCVGRAVEAARQPVPVDPAARARVMAAVRAGRGGWIRRVLRWLLRPGLRVSPLGALGAAAIVALLATQLGPRDAARPDAVLAPAAGATRVQFVLVAPGASAVSLVGDFNGWNAAATPLRPAGQGGLWTVEVPLDAGRYTYSFVVDGARWLPDPAAPAAPGDDFGRPSSVILVQGGST
ncbi:MAG TPA: isoamylase early set domain-containing protein [Longimicrobium sp.]|nr:isoamylase early set domain-containing protein [Longimicrobium sp.]